MFWFKQIIGQIPQVGASMHKFEFQPILHKEFINSNLIVAKAEADGIYLTILKMEPTDEAIYYCVYRIDYEVNFINGTFLCKVLSETCTAEHSVYWFRAGSGESHQGVIYTPGNRSDVCEKSPETPSPTKSCVYNLSKNNLSLSDAGTYYCAVATCGEILLCNGTNLNIEKATDPVIIALGVTSAVCVIGIIILICTRHTRPVCEHCEVGASQHIGHDNSTRESSSQDQDADMLNYAALNFSERKTKRGRKKRETPQESVYSHVRYSDWE
ncbi:unnamed protein product [Coregonus sp. 'balchen']|nr:unnamed protein product [Coregonus sp. 'balchen']